MSSTQQEQQPWLKDGAENQGNYRDGDSNEAQANVTEARAPLDSNNKTIDSKLE